MYLPVLSIISLLSLPATVLSQVAAGGGANPGTLIQPSQYPIVNEGPSLLVAGGTTTAVYQPFTQTFASTPLGTWALGPSPKAGTIGLGNIQGAVGSVKNGKDEKRDGGAGPKPTGQEGKLGWWGSA